MVGFEDLATEGISGDVDDVGEDVED